MGMRRYGSLLVEAVDTAVREILHADANRLRGQLIMLDQGTGDYAAPADVSGLFLYDLSAFDGTDELGS